MPTVTANMMAALKRYQVQPYAAGRAIGIAWAKEYLFPKGDPEMDRWPSPTPLHVENFYAAKLAVAKFIWGEYEMNDGLQPDQFIFGFSDGAQVAFSDAYTDASEALAKVRKELDSVRKGLDKYQRTIGFLELCEKKAKARFAS